MFQPLILPETRLLAGFSACKIRVVTPPPSGSLATYQGGGC